MPELSLISILRGLLGVVFLVAVGWVFSSNRKQINWRLVIAGLLLQVVFAILVLKVDFFWAFFNTIGNGFVKVLEFTNKGSEFLFGELVTDTDSYGILFAFKILPTVVFFSALTSLLYYLGILQKVVYGIAWVMKKTMRLSGAESLAAAANVFVGQTEAPLVIKPYIPKMTRSEMLCLMTGGMATIAGGVMSAFIGFLGGSDPEMQRFFATHLLTASLMSAPAAIVAAKLIVPETEQFDNSLKLNNEKLGTNILESISIGTTEGLKLAVNVGAMLLVFTAMIYLLNSILIGVGDLTGLNEAIAAGTGGMYKELSFQFLLGYLFSPVAWLIGVNNNDIFTVGQLLGEKTILNEFYAYTSFGNLKNAGVIVDTKTIVITTYALCGFSNFASIGIQIGGIGSLAPDKRTLLSQLGLRALLGGTIACLLTSAIIGMFY